MTVVHAARKAAATSDDPSNAVTQFEHWFGAFDPGRACFVENVYQSIGQNLTGNTLECFCDCHRNWYAHVQKGDGRLRVWLCRLFWRKAGDSGFNSRPGTLLHELAHQASGWVLDHGYGVSKAESFALHHPPTAIHNADNYAFFAESR